MYEIRTYRNWIEDRDLKNFAVKIEESDLFIRADKPLQREAEHSLECHRKIIQDYIKGNPEFAASLKPYSVDKNVPEIILKMSDASFSAGVGPMAAVAGAIAEFVGQDLLEYCSEVIVENGGDIFMKTKQIRKVGIFAGKSAYGGNLALEIKPVTCWGICTSSATVGPSLSFGRADAAVVICNSAILADAWATRLGNMVKSDDDIEKTLDLVKGIPEIKGAVIIVGDKIGACGDIKLTR